MSDDEFWTTTTSKIGSAIRKLDEIGTLANSLSAENARLLQKIATLELEVAKQIDGKQSLTTAMLAHKSEWHRFSVENEQLRAENERLRAFAVEIMDHWPDGDVDGGELQDIAVAHGLLVANNPQEPCGDNCRCVEYYAPDEWETGDVVCYRRTLMQNEEKL